MQSLYIYIYYISSIAFSSYNAKRSVFINNFFSKQKKKKRFFLASLPWFFFIITYDELRKFLMRRSPGGWIERNTYY